MIIDDTQKVAQPEISLELVWRNSGCSVMASLKAREKSNPYCRWAEQANKIRRMRSHWIAKNNWIE